MPERAPPPFSQRPEPEDAPGVGKNEGQEAASGALQVASPCGVALDEEKLEAAILDESAGTGAAERPDMSIVVVEVANRIEGRVLAGHVGEEETAGPENPVCLPDHGQGIGKMLDNLLGADDIQGPRPQGQEQSVRPDARHAPRQTHSDSLGRQVNTDGHFEFASAEVQEPALPTANVHDAAGVGEMTAEDSNVLT